MKAKKASKRLRRVEGLLTAILDGYATAEHEVLELLDKAKTAVSAAMTSMDKLAAKKPPARATERSASPAFRPAARLWWSPTWAEAMPGSPSKSAPEPPPENIPREVWTLVRLIAARLWSEFARSWRLPKH